MDTDRRDAGIVGAIAALAHNLGLGLVAEGVEEVDQTARLRDYGCDELQGYLFSRPVPAETLERLLADSDTGSRARLRDEVSVGLVMLAPTPESPMAGAAARPP